MIEKITETQITVLESVNGINVLWTDIITDAEREVARSNRAQAFSRYERELFLSVMADHPSAVTYADLAGLEVRPAVPEPTPEPQS